TVGGEFSRENLPYYFGVGPVRAVLDVSVVGRRHFKHDLADIQHVNVDRLGVGGAPQHAGLVHQLPVGVDFELHAAEVTGAVIKPDVGQEALVTSVQVEAQAADRVHAQPLRIHLAADAERPAALGLVFPHLEQVVVVLELTGQVIGAFFRRVRKRQVTQVHVPAVLHGYADQRIFIEYDFLLQYRVLDGELAFAPAFHSAAEHTAVAQGADTHQFVVGAVAAAQANYAADARPGELVAGQVVFVQDLVVEPQPVLHDAYQLGIRVRLCGLVAFRREVGDVAIGLRIQVWKHVRL